MTVIILINQEYVALNTYTERLNIELFTVDNDRTSQNIWLLKKKRYILLVHALAGFLSVDPKIFIYK